MKHDRDRVFAFSAKYQGARMIINDDSRNRRVSGNVHKPRESGRRRQAKCKSGRVGRANVSFIRFFKFSHVKAAVKLERQIGIATALSCLPANT